MVREPRVRSARRVRRERRDPVGRHLRLRVDALHGHFHSPNFPAWRRSEFRTLRLARTTPVLAWRPSELCGRHPALSQYTNGCDIRMITTMTQIQVTFYRHRTRRGVIAVSPVSTNLVFPEPDDWEL